MSNDIVDRNVLYMPMADFVTARDGTQVPILTIRKQTGHSQQIVSKSSLRSNSERLRIVILSALHDCPVEGRSVYTKHSYQSGRPTVPDSKGIAQRQPSAGNALAGSSAVDWIDAPPANFSAVGVWATNRPAFSFYGSDIGLTAEMPGRGARLQISVIMNIKASKFCVNATLTDLSVAAVSDDDFYDLCNQKSYSADQFLPNATKLTSTNVKVSIRMGGASYGYDLYAFVEPK